MSPAPDRPGRYDFDLAAQAKKILSLRDQGQREQAIRKALTIGELCLGDDPDGNRESLFHEMFKPLLKSYHFQYQPYDFELVDYELYEFARNMPLVRGPQVSSYDICAGNYCVVLGAAQLFGRFQPRSINVLLKERYGLPVLNLAVGGAGPLLFANNPAVIEACRRARFVILQMLSGRSIGCDEYPGERMTAPAAQPGAPRRDRNEILGEIWRADRNEAIRLVRKWNANYVQAYRELIKRIGRPVVLAWLSNSSSDNWRIDYMKDAQNFGQFPHLVSREMIEAIRPSAAGYVEGGRDEWIGAETTSRFDGRPAPFFLEDGPGFKPMWRNVYYASARAVEDLVARLSVEIDKLAKS
jgi:hypothetical protein